ncbi:MAG: UDP-N-acetylglucosamine 1-carboxyvinyltransferase, partial [Thermotogae bacterium]
MGSFVVEGPVQLSGNVEVSGAKNAALPILAAVPVVKGETILHNVPRLEDVFTMIQILE